MNEFDFMSSLEEAVLHDDMATATLLLKYGKPDWHIPNSYEMGWLSFALSHGADRAFLELMKLSGAVVNESGVVVVAAKMQLHGALEWLLANGASFNEDNWFAGFEAIKLDDVVALQLLINNGILYAQKPIWVRDTLLSEVCKYGATKCMELLLNSGVDVNEPTLDGISPLEICLAHRKMDFAEKLLDAGAKISPSEKQAKQWGLDDAFQTEMEDDSERSWMESSRKGFPWVLLILEQSFLEKYRLSKMLLRGEEQAKGASPGGKTVLHEIVKDKSWVDSTALGLSPDDASELRMERVALARTALAHGATPDAEDCLGWTPMLLAISLDDREMFDVFLSRSNGRPTMIGSPLGLAASLNRIVLVEKMLKAGFSTLSTDIMGKTPKMLAEEKGFVAVFNLLCDYESKLVRHFENEQG